MIKRIIAPALLTLAFLATSVHAHDPRTAIKDYGSSLSVEGTGKLSLVFKALHWNEGTYAQVQANPTVRKRLSDTLWVKIGSATFDFDVTMGEGPSQRAATLSASTLPIWISCSWCSS